MNPALNQLIEERRNSEAVGLYPTRRDLHTDSGLRIDCWTRAPESNNPCERFHDTEKERFKVVRAFDGEPGARRASGGSRGPL